MHRLVRRTLVAAATVLVAGPAVPAWPQAAPDAPRVKLLDAGAAPRRPLRYTTTVGAQRSMVMSMKMSMEMSMGGSTMPAQKVPETRMTMNMKVVSVAPNGDIRYEFTMLKPEIVAAPDIPAMVVQAMKDAFQGLESVKGHAVVTNRGFTLEADIQMPPNANPQVRQFIDNLKPSIRQVGSPLPEEPVGQGARWETTMRLDQGGMTLDQLATSHIVSLAGNRTKVAIGLTQTAKPQKMSPPGLPPGAAVELQSHDAKGKGEMDLDLTQLIPTLATVDLTSNTRMKISAQGQIQEMAMKMDMTMEMRGK